MTTSDSPVDVAEMEQAGGVVRRLASVDVGIAEAAFGEAASQSTAAKTPAASPRDAPTSEIGYTHAGVAGWYQLQQDEAPELAWPLSIDVFDRMRRQDAQVLSVLRAVTLPVRRTTWSLDPAGAREEVVRLVSADLGLPVKGETDPTPPLRTRNRFSWADHLRHALLMLTYGHMFFEQRYDLLPTGPGGSLQARLRKLAPRMPRTIAKIDVAPDGGLVSITQHPGALGQLRTKDGMPKPIPVNRLVAYVNDREGGNWLGQSLVRSAYKDWLIKDRVLRTWAQSIDRNGMGVPLYIGPENPSDPEADLDKGAKLAQSWRSGNAAGASVPHGADLVLRGVDGRLVDPEKAVRYLDEQIARAVLAHFLNLGTQTGSWALGSTFADFFTLSLSTVAEAVQDVANAHVVEDMVDLNFGPEEPAPRVVFAEIGSQHTATAEAIAQLVNAGVIFPDRQMEEFVRQAYSLPPKQLPTSVDV